MLLPNVLPPELPVPPTVAPLHNASCNHSLLAHAFSYVPPIENVHANSNSLVQTQGPLLPTVLILESHAPLAAVLLHNTSFDH